MHARVDCARSVNIGPSLIEEERVELFNNREQDAGVDGRKVEKHWRRKRSYLPCACSAMQHLYDGCQPSVLALALSLAFLEAELAASGTDSALDRRSGESSE